MFISRLFTFATAALASVSLVAAAPTAETGVLVKRGTEDIALGVLITLSESCGVQFGIINNLVLTGGVTLETLEPPCTTITSLIIEATVQLTGLPPGSWDGSGSMPLVYAECAGVLVALITALVNCFYPLLAFVLSIPQILTWFASCDGALTALLNLVGLLLYGVLGVVSTGVSGLVWMLLLLLFTLTLACLHL